MTLREAYAALGGDYEATRMRLMNETLMRKYLRMFAEDDSFPKLQEAFGKGEEKRESGNNSEAEAEYREAFEAAHALKGVAYNLGMDSFGRSIDALCESLRNGFTEETPALYVAAEKDYSRAMEILREIEE